MTTAVTTSHPSTRWAWAAVAVLLLGQATLGAALIAGAVELMVVAVVLGIGGLLLARRGRIMTTPVEFAPKDTPWWAGGERRRGGAR